MSGGHLTTLRTPFLVLATLFAGIIVLLDIGAAGILAPSEGGEAALRASVQRTVGGDIARTERALAEIQRRQSDQAAPGLAIPALALMDGALAYTLLITAIPLVVSRGVTGRVQGITTLVIGIVLTLAGLAAIGFAFARLTTMFTLLAAAPFGPIVYLGLFGFFDRSGAAAILGLGFMLKLGTAAGLVAAQQRFLQQIGLVLIVLSSLLAGAIVSLLHGLVPLPLVSVSDAIAAIVVAAIGIIWAVALVFGAVVALSRLLKPPATATG